MNKYTLIILLLLATAPLLGQESTDFTIGEIFEMDSKALGEEREYIVSLPASYQGDEFYVEKNYPVLILLDGQRLFHLVSAMIHSMSSGGIEQIPEMIVVGVNQINRNQELVPLESDDEQRRISSKDFRRFIEEELVPEIERKYRTIDCRIIVGHSFGGLFVIESFLESNDYEGYLAIDPSLWWADEILNLRAKEILQNRDLRPLSIYISQSNNPFDEGLVTGRLGKAIQGFKKTLEQTSSRDLRYKFDFFEKEDHFSIPLISLYEGLQYLFKGYKYPLNEIKSKEIKEIDEHYKSLMTRLGGEVLPPGKLLNQVGLYLLRNESIEKGIALLELNKEYYSNSYIPYNSLGEAYLIQENEELALKHFMKSVEINPGNEHARRRINELRNE